MIVYNPFTQQVLNVNPRGCNQYSGPECSGTRKTPHLAKSRILLKRSALRESERAVQSTLEDSPGKEGEMDRLAVSSREISEEFPRPRTGRVRPRDPRISSADPDYGFEPDIGDELDLQRLHEDIVGEIPLSDINETLKQRQIFKKRVDAHNKAAKAWRTYKKMKDII